ncbi:MAG: hypothetical protein OEW00_12325 [candidate division Zixibacteria bacterium]|nr:hypothetical protein [candidate division Zixibacteria bacterium]
MYRMSLPVVAAGLILLVAGCTSEKKSEDVVAAATLLPEKVASAGLERSSEPVVFEGQALYEHINGGAEIYHLYDFVEVAATYYQRDETEIAADIYRFADADNAYGLYSTLRPDEPLTVNLGVEGFASPSSLDFVKGSFVVRLVAYDESAESAAAIDGLGKALADIIPGRTEPPEMFSRLPTQNRIPHTDRIYAESFLGQKALKEVYTRTYALGGDTLIAFALRDRGGEQLRQWTSALEPSVEGEKPGGYDFDDGTTVRAVDSYYGEVIAGKKGDLLLGLVNFHDSHRAFLSSWLSALP